MREDKFPDLERRKFTRLRDNIFIWGNLKSDPIREFKAFTEDISAGGLMFETERDISKDKELEFQIYQPVLRRKRIIFSIPVLAKIIWTRKIDKDKFEEGENKYRVGIKFLEIGEENRQRIAKYIDENLAKK